jgi:glycosyltransferase involved in cell wall biosynthesis
MTSDIPKFSLILPTLRRADTFRHALATLVSQDYDDFEIVVQNNGRDPEVEAAVGEFRHPKIRYFSTDAVLPMTENWETALANARGEFVTVVGDDDGLFPDACRIAARVIDQASLEIVSWSPYCYYWPDFLNAGLANRLAARVDDEFFLEIVESDRQIRRFYRFAIGYFRLPMIYNSFVRRSVLDRATQANGRYFFGYSPDVVSGIVNACQVEAYGRLSQPLSVSGQSRHSTGHNLFFSKQGHKSSARYRRDFSPAAEDPRLVEAELLQMFVARDMLLAHALMLANRNVDFDFRGLIESMAASINDRPEFYDGTLDAIRALASLHQVDLDTIAIPAKADEAPSLACGAFPAGAKSQIFVVDGDAAGLSDIAGAVRYAAERFGRPATDQAVEIRASRVEAPRVVAGGELIEFRRGGNGASALHSGWSEREDWGAWSVRKIARLTLRTEPERDQPLRLELKLRPFLHPLHPETNIVCRSRGAAIARWRASLQSAPEPLLLTVPSEDIDDAGAFELELLIQDPCAPSQLGVSTDTRLLGVGIESLCAPA